MVISFSVPVMLLLTGGIINLFYAILLWPRRSQIWIRYFIYLTIAQAGWSIFACMEASSMNLEDKILFSRLEYPFVLAVGPLWYEFAYSYVHKAQQASIWKHALLWVLPAIFLGLLLADYKLFWPEITPIVDTSTKFLVEYKHGILSLGSLAYAYLLILGGCYSFVRYLFVNTGAEAKRAYLMLIAISIPIVASAIYYLGLNPLPGIELTPLAFTVTVVVVGFSIFKYQLFELTYISRNAVFSVINSGVIVADSKNQIIDVNPAAKKIFGIDLLGLTLNDLSTRWPVLKLNSKSGIHEFEISVEKILKHISVQITPLKQENLDGYALIIQDISLRKNAEQLITETEFKFKSVVDSLPDATFVIDLEGKVLLWNRACEISFKVKAEDIIGKGNYIYSQVVYGKRYPVLCDMAIHPELENPKHYTSFKKDKDVLTGERVVNTSRNETRYFWIIAKPLYDSNGNITGSIECIRDTTDRKEISVQLTEKVDELERLNKIMLGRELKIIELKEELEKFKSGTI